MSDRRAPPDQVADLQQRCKALGIPLTLQRRAVYAALVARRDHPTAEQVFDDLHGRVAGISKATTYRALDTLVELGLVTRVSHPSSVARYDAKTSRHHHLVCDHCGAVADLESRVLDQLAMPDLSHRGFTMRDFSVHVRGLCERCRPAAGTTRPKDLQAARRPLRAAGAGRHRSKNRSRP